MRRASILAAVLVFGLAEGAQAQSTGGAAYEPLRAAVFRLSPSTIAPGARLTVRYRILARVKRVRVRLDLLPEGQTTPAATRHLGRRRTGRRFTARWRPQLAPGRYTARLRASTLKRDGRGHASSTSLIEIEAPAVTSTAGVFPVRGPYTFGGDDSRFGAKRSGHVHQGQDISAAAGTPVVAPRTGFISWRAYQADGAGFYLVLHADDERDYVFMHLKDGTLLVDKGDGVTAGQPIAAVGTSGASTGPHLHFEIWPDGWYSSKQSAPIDPLPDLLAWAGLS
ncbi:MAG TPA: M23 family metallopeptidase [Solirubrobacteraceae bacterium]|nr:M23 family metallopeptidase [Solirubrobacteraceae bacterium]